MGVGIVNKCRKKNRDSRMVRIVSILLSFGFITVPVFYLSQPAEATDWQEATGSGLMGAQVGGLAGFAFFDGAGSIVGAGTGFLTAMVGDLIGQDQRKAAEVLDAKGPYVHELRNITSNYLGMADSAAQNQIVNYETQTYYFGRKAEDGALCLYQNQSNAHQNYSYNTADVLTRSEVSNSTMASMWYISSQYASILNQYSNLTDSFTGSYSGLLWGYSCAGASYTSSLEADSYREALVGYEVNTNGSGYLTLAGGFQYLVYNRDQIQHSAEITVTSRNGTTVADQSISLSPGEGFWLSVPSSADYKIRSSTAQNDIAIFGVMAQSITDGQRPEPTILTRHGEDRGLIVDGHGIDSIWFGDPSNSVSLLEIYAKLDQMEAKVHHMQAVADSFAQAYWKTLITAGGALNRLAPDVAFPDPMNIRDLSPEQIYSVYLAYLVKMKTWFASNTILDPNNVTISEESLKLKVRGAIYDPNGTMLFGPNTIFTPYVSLDPVTLLEANVTMSAPCFAMRWGSADSLEQFHNISDMLYIDLPAGSVLSVKELYYNNTPVDNLTLNVTSVNYVIHDNWDPLDPPQSISVNEWLFNHWYYFALVFSATVLLGAAVARSKPIMAVGAVASIIAIVGWVLSWIT